MFEISDITVAPLGESLFVKPMEIHYTLNGYRKKWDYIQAHNSVAIIIFNVSRNVFVLVKQFRPAKYVRNIPCEEQKGLIDCKKYPSELGLTLEFCAGLVDKNIPLEQIAKEEVMEETGYDVPVEKLEKIRVFNTAVGPMADEVNLYYVEVEDSMKVGKGGGLVNEGEFIEVVELTLLEAKKLCDSIDSSSYYAGFLFGLLWFFHYKAPKLSV